MKKIILTLVAFVVVALGITLFAYSQGKQITAGSHLSNISKQLVSSHLSKLSQSSLDKYVSASPAIAPSTSELRQPESARPKSETSSIQQPKKEPSLSSPQLSSSQKSQKSQKAEIAETTETTETAKAKAASPVTSGQVLALKNDTPDSQIKTLIQPAGKYSLKELLVTKTGVKLLEVKTGFETDEAARQYFVSEISTLMKKYPSKLGMLECSVVTNPR